MSNVQELEAGIRPPINKGAITIYDKRSYRLYIYGGIRWAENEDVGSPTTEPTADFFCINLFSLSSLKWRNYTESMREDNSLASPFKEEVSLPEPHGLDLPRLGALPALQDPIGAVVYDDTAAKHTYILILGDPIGVQHKHPVLLCINITLNTWRRLRLRNERKLMEGRARGSMVVVGEMRSQSDIFLCVFGGITENVVDETNLIESLDTYAVANLTKEVWITPNGKVPASIGPLGIRPGLEVFYNSEDNRFKVLILKGAVEDERRNTEESAQAEFSKAYQFDPQASSFQSFAEIPLANPSKFPRPAKMLILQTAQSKPSRHFPYSFLLMTCGAQRELNAIPPRADEPHFLEKFNDFYIEPDIKLWIAELGIPQNVCDFMSSEENQHEDNVQIPDADDTSSSEEDTVDSSSSSSDDEPPQTSILTQRAKKSGPKIFTQHAMRTNNLLVPKTRATLSWHSILAGRVKTNIELISPSFRLETACLLGDLPPYSKPAAYPESHPLSPRLIFMGCEHEFLGQILGDVYNALASIPLHSLLETEDEEELISERESEVENEERSTTTATSELDSADEDALMMSPGPARQPDFTIATDEFATLDELELEAGALRDAESADAFFIPPTSDFEPLDAFEYEVEEAQAREITAR